MTKKQKLLAWSLIILSYVFSYGTALAAAYHYLAKETLAKEGGKGGAVFYLFVGVLSLVLVISVNRLIHKMKANTFKSLFRGITKVGFIFVVKLGLMYANVNAAALINVMDFTLLGMVLGIVTEMFVVHKYNAYIREVGIL